MRRWSPRRQHRARGRATAARLADRARDAGSCRWAEDCAILFNNPHNPTARLFERDELEAVASVAREHDLIVISDEVWEHVVLDRHHFASLASLPGMAKRTIKIGSAGKIFSLTGWKVGWMIAAPELGRDGRPRAPVPDLLDGAQSTDGGRVRPGRGRRMARANAAAVRPCPRPDDRRAARRRICRCSTRPRPTSSASTSRASGIAVDDETFATAAVEKAGVAVVPLSAFVEQAPPRHLVRLCFGKKDETIDAGVAAMAKVKEMFA